MKNQLKKSRVNLAVAMAVGLPSAMMVTNAHAIDGKIGGFDYRLTSTVSIGTSMRVQSQDRALYAVNNTNEDGTRGTGQSNTSDDGNLNFKKGDTFSTVIKGVHELDLNQDNYGFFTRVKWFYDHTLNNKKVFHGHEPTGNARNQKLDDSNFNNFAKFDGVNLLDAFGYVNTEVAGMPLDARLGRQVISWGESTLILSPISGLNTIDLSALRRPGAEIKEAFTPTEFLSFNLGVTDDTSLEGFYQIRWRETVPEGCGTYFSTSDFVAEGCNRLAFASPGLAASGVFLNDQQELAGITANAVRRANGQTLTPVNRSANNEPGDGGQFGLALRKYLSELDAEVGGYYLNYHYRLPLVGVRTGNFTNAQIKGAIAAGGGTPPAALDAGPANAAAPYALGGNTGASYLIQYPEDISVLGLTVATNIAGWSVSGEVTRARDVPLQYNANDLLIASLFGNAASLSGSGSRTVNSKVGNTAVNTEVEGFERFDVTQIQMTGIKTFDRALGSNTVVFLGEVGAVSVSGLPDQSQTRFGRNAVFGAYNPTTNPTTDGFVSDFSWGYRMRLRGVYRNAIGNIDLIPGVAWSHDVKGWSPEPGQAFNEGRKTIGLSMGFEFDANTKAGISYTRYSDSARFDALRDRDFVSLSGSLSF